MSPWKAPPRGGYSAIGNSKPGTPPRGNSGISSPHRRTEAPMKQTLELDLSKGVSKEKLAAFAAAIPDGVEIITEISHIPKDRPGESDKTTAALYAAWTM